MRLEVDSIYYYDVLNIYDRLCDEIKKGYGNLAKASLILGYNRTFLYSYSHIGSVNQLFRVCEKLNLDFAYILTGKKLNPKKTFSLEKLLHIYYNRDRSKRIPDNIKAIMSMLKKKKKKNIRLATLLYLSELLSIRPLDLI